MDARRLLHHNEGAGGEPAALGRAGESRRREVAAIGRIAEDQGEGAAGADRTQPRRIPPEQARRALGAERLDVLADQRPRFRPLVNEERLSRPPR